MNTNEDKQIEEIIQALKYAVGDIEHNLSRPLSCFILCVCCIDAMGAVRYFKGGSGDRFEKFIDNYMNEYSGQNIYKVCRSKMVHNYSSNRKYGVTHDEAFTARFDTIGGKLIIQTTLFAQRIKSAFEELQTELLEGKTDARAKAIKWDNKPRMIPGSGPASNITADCFCDTSCFLPDT